MRVHHLSCAEMRPPSVRRVVAHVLAVESAHGIVLVDSGFGLLDVERPVERLGRAFLWMNRPQLRREHTAHDQLRALGFAAADVRHIIATHLDADHAGGLADFPEAFVHLHKNELEALMHPHKIIERLRYRAAQLAHRPRWQPHEASGERWLGFESVRAVAGLDEILLIPLPGHSRGHTAVAVRRDDGGWLLHCGDAYFCKSELAEPPFCPTPLDWVQRLDEVDRAARLANQARLRTLARDRGGEVELFCAHDSAELDHYLHRA